MNNWEKKEIYQELLGHLSRIAYEKGMNDLGNEIGIIGANVFNYYKTDEDIKSLEDKLNEYRTILGIQGKNL